jgi:sterol desaturase/sphingolipid hydroxylase (fatty acid hydroxylase superfamily)
MHSGSTATTGGLANPVVSFFEMIGSVVFSILAVLVPVIAVLLLALFVYLVVKIFRHIRFRTNPLV